MLAAEFRIACVCEGIHPLEASPRGILPNLIARLASNVAHRAALPRIRTFSKTVLSPNSGLARVFNLLDPVCLIVCDGSGVGFIPKGSAMPGVLQRKKTQVVVATVTERPSRLLPSTELPGYTYVPGSDTPHPIRDPRGHSYQRKSPPPKLLTSTSWAENRHYLLALDYFNHGYYWEAHEEWERLWRASGPDTTVGKFLKGLVKLSAAGVKVRENSIHGVRRHAASAGEVFADVAAEVGTERFCGLEFVVLQFAADRAAQIAYRDRISSPHKPARVFPFVLATEPLPLA